MMPIGILAKLPPAWPLPLLLGRQSKKSSLTQIFHWLLVAWLAAAQTASAQTHSLEAPGQASRKNETVAGFEQFPGPVPEIRTNFLLKPGPDADQTALKAQIIYSRVLLDFVGRQLLRAPLRECALLPQEFGDASLELRFVLSRVPAPGFAAGLFGEADPSTSMEVALSYCTRLLSGLLKSAVIDRSTFVEIIRSNLEILHRHELLDFKYGYLSAMNAAEEALRHIYPPGSKARLFLRSVEDYERADFDEFNTWFARQQAELRRLVGSSPAESAISPALPDEEPCSPTTHLNIEELNLDHHGWGHRAIILIKNEYTRKPGWSNQMDTALLQNLCGPGSADTGHGIRCRYRIVDRDRWLIFYGYGTRESPSAAEMRDYAQAIADASAENKCADPARQLLVVSFSRQR
jgi:hypothetical protein